MPLTGFTARAAGGRVVAALRERAGDEGAVERYHERTAERYTELLGHSKGVLMKAGQMFSLVDLGAAEGGLSPYQRALTRLQNNAPPMAPALARRVVEEDLGRRVEDVFAEFGAEPVAAASIGQVHRAVLPDGRTVAVKVQYPGVAEAIRDDMANTELLTTVLRLLSPATGGMPDLRAATAEIAERIGEELDYRREAANIVAFAELYRGHPYIRIPDIVPEACGDRVITMTYLDGMDWAAAKQADQSLKNTWAEVISRMVTGSYRHSDLFHADPHPGNYRFGADGRVGFLDFGCIKVLPEDQRLRMVQMLRATLEGRRSDLYALMTESGFFPGDSTSSGSTSSGSKSSGSTSAGSGLTVDEAYSWWADLVQELLDEQPVTYGLDDRDRVVRTLIDIRGADHPVRRMTIPRDYVFFSRISLSLGGILTALNATMYARAIVDELDGIAAPVTDVGRAHATWVRERGLPYGMDRHDRV